MRHQPLGRAARWGRLRVVRYLPGTDPTAAELQEARRDSTEALYDMMVDAGVPLGPADQRESFVSANAEMFSDSIELALEQAPAGSVEAYTEYLCEPPVDPDSPEFKKLTGDALSQLEEIKSKPEFAEVDWDSLVDQTKENNRKYAVIQAVMPLMLCGTAIKYEDPVDASELPQEDLSPELRSWIIDGVRLLCPAHVTETSTPTASGDQECGPLPDRPDSVVSTEAATISCDEAVDLIARYLTDPRTERGDRGAQMGDWGCNILGAAEAEELGYWIACKNEGAG